MQIKFRPFDVFRVLSLLWIAYSIVLQMGAEDAAGLVHGLGSGLMALSMSIYLFRFRGVPIHQRPPVVFRPLVLILLAVFCFGALLCGAGFAGWPVQDGRIDLRMAFGLVMMIAPTTAAILATLYLASPTGRSFRESLARRHSVSKVS